MRGGIAAAVTPPFIAAPVVAVRPAVESWTLTLVQVERWFKAAAPGDRLVYAHGPQLVDGAAAARIRELATTEEVLPFQRRHEDGGFDYVAMRSRVRIVRPSRTEADLVLADGAANRIFLRLKEQARRGERCDSDAALAALAQVTTDQAKWRLRRLTSAGLISTRVVSVPTDPKYRVVTICATGCETALPGAGR